MGNLECLTLSTVHSNTPYRDLTSVIGSRPSWWDEERGSDRFGELGRTIWSIIVHVNSMTCPPLLHDCVSLLILNKYVGDNDRHSLPVFSTTDWYTRAYICFLLSLIAFLGCRSHKFKVHTDTHLYSFANENGKILFSFIIVFYYIYFFVCFVWINCNKTCTNHRVS